MLQEISITVLILVNLVCLVQTKINISEGSLENVWKASVEFGLENRCKKFTIFQKNLKHVSKFKAPYANSNLSLSVVSSLESYSFPIKHPSLFISLESESVTEMTNMPFQKENIFFIKMQSVEEMRVIPNLRYNSMMFPFILHESNNSITIYEAYKIHSSFSENKVNYFGIWSEENGLQLDGRNIWDRRGNMERAVLRATSIRNQPYVTKFVMSCSSRECFQGIFADIFHELSSILNFDFTITTPPDGEFGTKLQNGTWTGMVAQVLKGEADIAPADFTVTAIRSEAVDFLTSLTEIHMRFLIKNPADSFNWTAFIEPLTWPVWICVGILIIILPVFLSTFINYGYEPERRNFTLMQSYGFVSGALTIAKGWSVTPTTLKNRILFYAIILCGALVYWHWEAMIISYLAVRTIILPFRSLDELMSSTDFKIVVRPGTSYIDDFKYSNTPIVQKAWKERIEPFLQQYPRSRDEMSTYILENPSFAIFDNFIALQFNTEYKKCEVVDIPKQYWPRQFAFITQKESPYFDAFDYHLSNMKERGQVEQIVAKYAVETPQCPEYSGKPLGFNQCFTAFIALIAGNILGLIIMTLEKLSIALLFNVPSDRKALQQFQKAKLQQQIDAKEDEVKIVNKEILHLRRKLKQL